MKNNTANKQKLNKIALPQRGFSLVELMVAMVVGLILIYGVVEIYVNSKGAYNVNEENSRMQENARFAFDLMVPTVRQAGYSGCLALNSKPPKDIRKIKIPDFSAVALMTGSEYTGSGWVPGLPTGLSSPPVVANTDTISVQSSVSCGANLTGNLKNLTAQVQISGSNTCAFKPNDPILITDCSASDLFTATSVSKSGTKVNIAHAKSVTGNTQNFLSKIYKEDAELLKPTSTTYYIGTGVNGPALMRRDNYSGTAGDELVEGVESMQVLYGVDTDTPADGVVDRYVKANAIPVLGNDWDKVIAVRISLLMRSIGDAATSSGSYTFAAAANPAVVTYGPDRLLRQEYTTTVQLRNRSLLP